MSWLSEAFHAIFGGGKKNAPPAAPPPVAPPTPAAPITQASSAATTEAAISEANLPVLNRRKQTLASLGTTSVGNNLGASTSLGG